MSDIASSRFTSETALAAKERIVSMVKRDHTFVDETDIESITTLLESDYGDLFVQKTWENKVKISVLVDHEFADRIVRGCVFRDTPLSTPDTFFEVSREFSRTRFRKVLSGPTDLEETIQRVINCLTSARYLHSYA